MTPDEKAAELRKQFKGDNPEALFVAWFAQVLGACGLAEEFAPLGDEAPWAVCQALVKARLRLQMALGGSRN